MTSPDSAPPTAGPDLDARIADACGLEYQIVNDVCYVLDESEVWRTFHPSTNATTARSAAEKAGLAGVGESATALEVCAAILAAVEQRIAAAGYHADNRPTGAYNQLPADTWGKHPGMPTTKPEEPIEFLNADNVGKRIPRPRRK